MYYIYCLLHFLVVSIEVLKLCLCFRFAIATEMASNVAAMAFIPYYNHIMNILDTNTDLKKTFSGL